ncbi:hypothetical protein P167DRAFT_539751 [Morchella conica CCBAS932]|uniref:Uncharacterized protein n=1 Tax=Morchella conica CCBAS932 TaxID=1392247 RepID=A0A3N4KBH4_9PEZI|nr:hypothetical protein P167DRAFT_539751 [Morchella conica CCBAS932]
MILQLTNPTKASKAKIVIHGRNILIQPDQLHFWFRQLFGPYLEQNATCPGLPFGSPRQPWRDASRYVTRFLIRPISSGFVSWGAGFSTLPSLY